MAHLYEGSLSYPKEKKKKPCGVGGGGGCGNRARALWCKSY